MARIVNIVKEDNEFQRFSVLKSNRNKRFKYKEFFVEGVRNINGAIKNNWQIKSLIYENGRNLSDWAKEVIKTTDCQVNYTLTQELMKKISDKEEPSEVLSIVAMPECDLWSITPKKAPIIALFDRPSSQGNLGTIIRCCDALGVDGLVLTGHGVDLYDPETVRASIGSFFRVPVVSAASKTFEDITNWISQLKSKYEGFQVVGTTANTDVYLDSCDFTKPTLILIGNETTGLSHGFKELSDMLIKIPMDPLGNASSFNVACAASIVFYEAIRQRGDFKL